MRELGVAVCSHIFHGTRPVLLVVHDDGNLQFLCGDYHDEDEDWSLIGVNHLIDRDSTLGEMRVPEAGFQAERATVGASWSVRPFVWE